MDYKLSRAEMETTIRISGDEKVARIFTNDPSYKRKLDRLCQEHPEEYSMVRIYGGFGSKFYECPKKRVRFETPKSPEAVEAARKRFEKHDDSDDEE